MNSLLRYTPHALLVLQIACWLGWWFDYRGPVHTIGVFGSLVVFPFFLARGSAKLR